MKKIRIHTSKDELVNWDDLTEREKAIYEAGWSSGGMLSITIIVISWAIYTLFYLLLTK